MGWGAQSFSLLVLALLAAMLPATTANYDPSIFRTYFGCPPCEASQCPATEPGCELVKEPGICSCCHTCALQQGDPCGIYTNRCGQGLKCTPSPFADEPLMALFNGEGSCVKEEKALPLAPMDDNLGLHNEIKRHFQTRKRKVPGQW